MGPSNDDLISLISDKSLNCIADKAIENLIGLFGDPIESIVNNLTLLAEEYKKELKYFKIRKVFDGDNKLPKILLINGFLQKHSDVDDWLKSINKKFKYNTKLHLDWDSRNMDDFGNILFRLFKPGVAIPDLILNMWFRAYMNAEKAGIILANYLQKNNKSNYILMGHSLGCRVAYYAAKKLAEINYKGIDSMFLLSGAVGNQDWDKITNIVNKKIYNFYSPEDSILFGFYRASFFGLNEEPIGITRIAYKNNKIKNKDVTSKLEKYEDTSSFLHMRYKDALREFW